MNIFIVFVSLTRNIPIYIIHQKADIVKKNDKLRGVLVFCTVLSPHLLTIFPILFIM